MLLYPLVDREIQANQRASAFAMLEPEAQYRRMSLVLEYMHTVEPERFTLSLKLHNAFGILFGIDLLVAESRRAVAQFERHSVADTCAYLDYLSLVSFNSTLDFLFMQADKLHCSAAGVQIFCRAIHALPNMRTNSYEERLLNLQIVIGKQLASCRSAREMVRLYAMIEALADKQVSLI